MQKDSNKIGNHKLWKRLGDKNNMNQEKVRTNGNAKWRGSSKQGK